MSVRSWFAGAALVVSAVIGCKGGYQEAAQAPPDPHTAKPAEGMVVGSASYRERIALPPDAVLELWIADTSPGIVAQVLLAETTLATNGRQVPIDFAVRYDPGRVYADHSYGLKAAFKSGAEILFTNEQPVPVITQGHPTQVSLWLTRPGGAPSGGTAGGP